MIGRHHRLDGLEFEQTSEDSERQGSLVCCSPWGRKELDTTEQLNNNVHQQEDQYMHRGNLRKRRARKRQRAYLMK